MNEISNHLIIILLPLIISNVSHMLIVKKKYFDILNTPISVGLFGKNKTWRGFIFVPLSNAMMLVIVNIIFNLNLTNPAFLGLLLGLAYVLAELPNSWLKRKAGIQPGEQHRQYKIWFAMLDKTDSAFGVAFTYFLLGFVGIQMAFILFIVNSLTHILLSQLLVSLKVKSSF